MTQRAHAAGTSRQGETPKTPAEIALKSAETHLTLAEYISLADDIAAGRADVRVYDDGVVVVRSATTSLSAP